MESSRRESYNPYQVSPAGLKDPGSSGPGRPQYNPMAITSLACGLVGIAGFFICGITILLAPVAVVTGHIALSNLKATPNSESQGMAIAGLVTGYLGTLLLILAVVLLVFTLAVSD